MNIPCTDEAIGNLLTWSQSKKWLPMYQETVSEHLGDILRLCETQLCSTMSIYEVVDFVSGEQITLKDIVRGGEPMVVKEKKGSENIALWDCIA